MTTGDLLSFGPFLLDTHARRLTHDGADVQLAARQQLERLCLLASRPGEALAKDGARAALKAGALRGGQAGWGRSCNQSESSK